MEAPLPARDSASSAGRLKPNPCIIAQVNITRASLSRVPARMLTLNQQRSAVRLLDWGPIGYIGIISYGLYMWQGILTGNGSYRVTPNWPPDPHLGALLTFIVAPISFHFFERPISSLRRNFRSNKNTAEMKVGNAGPNDKIA